MNFNQMEKIIMIAELGNITIAARQLAISQPALSQLIRSVETEIGMPIFDRRTQPMRLTDAGERYLHTARKIMRYIAALNDEIQGTKSGQTGKIKIGLSQRRNFQIIPHIIKELVRSFPKICFELVDGQPDEQEKMIIQGKIDFYFGSLLPSDRRIKAIRLNHDRLMLAAKKSSPFARNHISNIYKGGIITNRISINEAASEHFILLRSHHRTRNIANQIFTEAQFVPDIIMEVDNSTIALNMISEIGGVTIMSVLLPSSMNIQPVFWGGRRGDIVFFALDSAYAMQDTYLFYDDTSYFTNVHEAFINIVQEKFHYIDTYMSLSQN
jgi:DNA-binding transcriptional LysR family regulator